MSSLSQVKDLLQSARFHIDGQMDCRTPAYHALDQLERAISTLVETIEEDQAAARRAFGLTP